MSDATKRADKWFRYVFKARDDRKLKLQVYEYSDPDDKVPVDFLMSQREVDVVGTVDCDFTRFPVSDFGTGYNERTRAQYHTADLRCKMSLSLDNLEVEVLFKRHRIGYTKISLKARAARRLSNESDHFYFDGDDTINRSESRRWDRDDLVNRSGSSRFSP